MNSISALSKDVEINRLTEQALCWEQEAEALFEIVGIQPGWKCIDQGCGPMGVLGPLSRRVGPDGQVVGVDLDPFCVQAANHYINQNQLPNVNVIRGDIYDTSFKPQSFNLSHLRFIFTQKGCDNELLEKMVKLTKPGGVIISQEADWSTWKCFPHQNAWEKIRKALITVFELDGGDINAGVRTYQMFKDAALCDIEFRSAILAMPVGHAYRSGLVRFAMSMREKIIGTGFLTESEFNKLMDECSEIIKNPEISISSYTLCQVWGSVN
jgi:ubiquinone/menaquinone biosynthesis C-methylase UbiE